MNVRETARKLINDCADEFKAGVLEFDNHSYMELIQLFFERVGIKITDSESPTIIAIAQDEWKPRHMDCTLGPKWIKQIVTGRKKYRKTEFVYTNRLKERGIAA